MTGQNDIIVFGRMCYLSENHSTYAARHTLLRRTPPSASSAPVVYAVVNLLTLISTTALVYHETCSTKLSENTSSLIGTERIIRNVRKLIN